MTTVYISVGSNIKREQHIRAAINSLRISFGELTLSSVYDSPAMGFDGDPFYNLVVHFDTELNAFNTAMTLHSIEDQYGRERNKPRFSARTLDIDMLLYGDEIIHEPGINVPRDEITSSAFVLYPLAEIAGDLYHPIFNKTIQQLLDAFNNTKSGDAAQIKKVAFDFSD